MNQAPAANHTGDEKERIIAFIRSIGIEVEARAISEATFLPGILIAHGRLVIDEDKLEHPGDLLHEAGHLAVMKPDERHKLYNSAVRDQMTSGEQGGEEMAAIAWSYAALTHLQLSPAIVFHPDGYKDDSDWLIEQFTTGKNIGLPLLQWMGMTCDAATAMKKNTTPFPAMTRWMRTATLETQTS